MKLCLVGGFLGSGKTTAIVTACSIFMEKKIPAAVITNDQGINLVDTAYTGSRHIPGTEVTNGCFCCNYEQFYSAIRNLESEVNASVIFAEAVGSCADLVATIVKPIQKFHLDLEISLSVFADGPVLLSLLEGRSFFVNENIQYIFKKQIEEAVILVINKSDMLTRGERVRMKSKIESEYPGKTVLFQNSNDKTSVALWLGAIEEKNEPPKYSSLDIDYEKYADGEASLAWLNAAIVIHSKGRAVNRAYAFIDRVSESISAQQLPIGHLKFFLQSGDWQQKISYAAGNTADEEPRNRSIKSDHASVIVNARVETIPDHLKQIFFQSVKKVEDESCHIEVLEVSAFRPGYPRPIHRMMNDESSIVNREW